MALYIIVRYSVMCDPLNGIVYHSMVYIFTCSQSECMDLRESVNVFVKAYPSYVYGKITGNCTGEF